MGNRDRRPVTRCNLNDTRTLCWNGAYVNCMNIAKVAFEEL